MSMKKPTKIILIFIVLIAIIAAGIINHIKNQETNSSDKGLKALALIPLTGYAAVFGEIGQNAITIATKHLNEEGIPVTTAFEDTKSSSTVALSALQKSLALEPPHIVFLESSPISLTAGPLVSENNILGIAFGSHPDITTKSPTSIRIQFLAKTEVEALFSKHIKAKSPKTISCAYMNTDYGKSFMDLVKKTCAKNGVVILGTALYDSKGKDFKNTVASLLQKKPDSVFIAGYGRSTGVFIRQLREHGFRGNIIGSSGLAYDDVIGAAGSAINGTIYMDAPFDPSSKTKFVNDYMAKTGEVPGPYAAMIYDGFTIAVRELYASQCNTEKTLRALKSGKVYVGECGSIRISSGRDFIYNLKAYTINAPQE